ncbi:MAG TPA: RHS repeat-associated core domain-containing protein [Candidatus Acidoferrales bacterium]|nr:RHS repeat-associated core domain-containing protein [Candidatus Acidoferrales bacterium]
MHQFASERVITAFGGNTYDFTGKERELESKLDNFEARYASGNIGRFMSPDWSAGPTRVPYADFGDPQTLNLYSFANNRPTTYIDGDGHCFEPITAGDKIRSISFGLHPSRTQGIMLSRKPDR